MQKALKDLQEGTFVKLSRKNPLVNSAIVGIEKGTEGVQLYQPIECYRLIYNGK